MSAATARRSFGQARTPSLTVLLQCADAPLDNNGRQKAIRSFVVDALAAAMLKP